MVNMWETDTYHDQKASMKPNQEKKKTRPYLLTGFRIGTCRALPVMGLTSGAEIMALKIPMVSIWDCLGY